MKKLVQYFKKRNSENLPVKNFRSVKKQSQQSDRYEIWKIFSPLYREATFLQNRCSSFEKSKAGKKCEQDDVPRQ